MKNIISFILIAGALLGLGGCSVYVVDGQTGYVQKQGVITVQRPAVVCVQQPTYLEIIAAQRMQATNAVLYDAQCQQQFVNQQLMRWPWNHGHRGHR